MAEAAYADDVEPPSVIWFPQDGPQTALISCPVFEVFYGGARGGGKTDGVLGEWIGHADQYGERAIGLMVRRERTQLIETIERSRQIYTPLGARYHEQDKMWRFPNGARLRFAYLERDADADAYQGHSYTRVYVEEIGTFPSKTPIMKLMATLRSGSGVPVGFRATGNPGGPGQGWVRDRYIDPAPAGWQIIPSTFTDPWSGEEVTRERVYIPSKLRDNLYLGKEYVANLFMSGSAQLVKAWLEGNWNAIEGAFFDQWSTERHVVRAFDLPKHWAKGRAFDWGYAKPFAVLWFAIASDNMPLSNGLILPRGGLVVYREWYGATAPDVGARLQAEQMAEGIKARDGDDEIALAVADPSIWNESGQAIGFKGPTIGERMALAGVNFLAADNRRKQGWDQMRGRIAGDAAGNPMMVAFDTCTEFIRTIPVLQHDEIKPEDLDTASDDHLADACRYFCMARPWARPKPVNDKPAVNEFGIPTLHELVKRTQRIRAGDRGRI